MQVLGGRFLELADTDVVSDSQPVDAQEPGNDTLGNLLLQLLPDEVIFAGEVGDRREFPLGSA
jgi:hypothetical protein